jgi:hypothetical protein
LSVVTVLVEPVGPPRRDALAAAQLAVINDIESSSRQCVPRLGSARGSAKPKTG